MSDSFLKEIQDSFLIEAEDLLNQTEGLFLSLEDNESDHIETFKQIKRLAHNFKGSGQAVGFDALAKFCHSLENLLVVLANKQLALNPEIIELLLACNDRLKDSIATLKIDSQFELVFSDLTERINIFYGSVDSSSQENVTESASSLPISNPFAINRAKNPTAQDEIQKQHSEQQSQAKSETKPNANTSEEIIRIPLKRIDELLNSFGEQVINLSSLEYLQQNPNENKDQIVKTIFNLKKIAFELQQSTLALRMVNMKNLFIKLERAIKDAARVTDKKVKIIQHGIEQELDKSIVERISDALTHMVRNSVDHGIESDIERMALNKPAQGTISLTAKKSGGEFILEISDDGKGMDPEKIRKKAIEKGLIKESDLLNKAQIFDLIFENGFSTKDQTTEISGRGIGMNVVKECIHDLKGRYEITSEVNQGTVFKIYLPLSLSMFNGMVTQINGIKYIIPTSTIDEVINFTNVQERSIGRKRIFNLRDEVIEIIDLGEVLKRQNSPDDLSFINVHRTSQSASASARQSLLITRIENKKYAFRVDSCQQIIRVVQKPLSGEMQFCPGATGVTILGDGKPAYILDTHKIRDHHHQQDASNFDQVHEL